MSSKRKAWEYSLQIKGVIGRDRKPKTHYFTLLETETADKVPAKDLEVLIARKLIEAKYKYGPLAIIEYPTVLDEHTSHTGKSHRSKVVEITKGSVVFRCVGYNIG